MKFLHVAASMSPEWGGPVTVLEGLIPALVRQGMECEVVTSSGWRVGTDVVRVPGAPIRCFDTGFPARVWTGYAAGMAAFLDQQLASGGIDVVYLHEIWHYPGFAAARAARRHGIPYVQTFHGALDRWRLRQKRFRKLAYRPVLKRQVHSAEALHVLTGAEKQQALDYGFTTTAFVIPNGIDPPPRDAATDTADFLSRHPRLQGKRVVLFLGRLHPMKGLDILARSFSRIASRIEDAVLLVAGPEEDGTESAIESILRSAGRRDRAVFTGMLTGGDKGAALACADLFVLPSHSEGFSNAILEAMAAGLPVVISGQCHFPEAAEHEAGFVVDNTESAVATAVITLLADEDLRIRMGRNGRRLVAERYTWDSVARSVIDMVRTFDR